jgi:hypothetical protein
MQNDLMNASCNAMALVIETLVVKVSVQVAIAPYDNFDSMRGTNDKNVQIHDPSQPNIQCLST